MRSWCIAFCLCLPALGQDAQGVIEGTVRNAITGAPVDGVSIELMTQASATSATARCRTPSSGAFRFAALPESAYFLRFHRSGYVDSDTDGGPIIAARATPGAEPLNIALVPTGSIEGRVLDEDGVPLKGVLLYAERPSKPSLMTVSEDGGRYRLDPLPPDEFLILARISYSLRKETAKRDGSTGQMLGFPPSLYVPGVEDAARASAVSVEAGSTLGGFDVRLKRMPLVAVSGTATDGETRQPFKGEIEIAPEKGASDGARVALPADGAFTFDLIPAGRYALLFYRDKAKNALAYSAPVDTGVSGSAGLTVAIPAFTRVMGRVMIPTEKVADLGSIDVVLSNGRQSRGTRAGADGSFVFDQVPPGSWRMGASPADRSGARAWYVSAIHSGPRDVMTDGLLVQESVNTPVEIVLGTDAAAVRGAAPAGARVRIADVDGHVVAEQIAQPTGAIWISGLRPGDYKIYAGACTNKAVTVKLMPSMTAAVRLEACTP